MLSKSVWATKPQLPLYPAARWLPDICSKYTYRVSMNLAHHFLIAMPSLQDPLFKRSVIYVCEHNDEGAMGLMVNKPMENLTIEGVLSKLDITPQHNNAANTLEHPVYNGGPVAEDRGFILHSPQHNFASSVTISDGTVLTTSKDVLESLGSDQQPENIIVALGYCSWEKEQLENEILENAWLIIPASEQILFHTPAGERWRNAAKPIGVDISQMSGEAGHA